MPTVARLSPATLPAVARPLDHETALGAAVGALRAAVYAIQRAGDDDLATVAGALLIAVERRRTEGTV